jgi:hypothetical protein
VVRTAIRTAVHALAERGLVILTKEHLGWAGRGEYGRMVRYDNLYFSDRKDGREPTKIIPEGERFKFPGPWTWSRTAPKGGLKLILSGMPTHGLVVWLPDRKADRDKRVAERTAEIRKLLRR